MPVLVKLHSAHTGEILNMTRPLHFDEFRLPTINLSE